MILDKYKLEDIAFIEWVDLYDAPCHSEAEWRKVEPSAIIKSFRVRSLMNPFHHNPNMTDEEIIDEFVVVNWAKVILKNKDGRFTV